MITTFLEEQLKVKRVGQVDSAGREICKMSVIDLTKGYMTKGNLTKGYLTKGKLTKGYLTKGNLTIRKFDHTEISSPWLFHHTVYLTRGKFDHTEI